MKENILLIGGSSSVGQNLCLKIDKKLFNIYITYYKNSNVIKNKSLTHINKFLVDLNNDEEIIKLIDNFKKKKINFHKILFMQGSINSNKIHKYKNQNIKEIVNLNLLSIYFFVNNSKSILNKRCLLIFLSSISAYKGSYDPFYSSTKSALIGLTKSIAKNNSPNVKCLCVAPGLIKDSKMYKDMNTNIRNIHLKNTPNKELLNLNDFSMILIDLLKPHWRHANGSIIDINGGVL